MRLKLRLNFYSNIFLHAGSGKIMGSIKYDDYILIPCLLFPKIKNPYLLASTDFLIKIQ